MSNKKIQKQTKKDLQRAWTALKSTLDAKHKEMKDSSRLLHSPLPIYR